MAEEAVMALRWLKLRESNDNFILYRLYFNNFHGLQLSPRASTSVENRELPVASTAVTDSQLEKVWWSL